MKLPPGFSLTASTEDKDLAYLRYKLGEFNHQQQPFTQKPHLLALNYVLKSPENKIMGGIISKLYCWSILYIDILWVDKDYRGQGLGRLLLEKAETEADQYHCTLIHLDTFDFQAKDFYLKQGYEVFGVLDNCPPGRQRFFLKKEKSRVD